MTTNISYYIRRYIMTTNIFIIRKLYFSLYKTMYNKIICCHYIRRYIMTTNNFIIHEVYFSLYKKIYNDNKYFYYTSKCISVIQDDV